MFQQGGVESLPDDHGPIMNNNAEWSILFRILVRNSQKAGDFSRLLVAEWNDTLKKPTPGNNGLCQGSSETRVTLGMTHPALRAPLPRWGPLPNGSQL